MGEEKFDPNQLPCITRWADHLVYNVYLNSWKNCACVTNSITGNKSDPALKLRVTSVQTLKTLRLARSVFGPSEYCILFSCMVYAKLSREVTCHQALQEIQNGSGRSAMTWGWKLVPEFPASWNTDPETDVVAVGRMRAWQICHCQCWRVDSAESCAVRTSADWKGVDSVRRLFTSA